MTFTHNPLDFWAGPGLLAAVCRARPNVTSREATRFRPNTPRILPTHQRRKARDRPMRSQGLAAACLRCIVMAHSYVTQEVTPPGSTSRTKGNKRIAQ